MYEWVCAVRAFGRFRRDPQKKKQTYILVALVRVAHTHRARTCLQFCLMANVSSLLAVIWFVRIRGFLVLLIFGSLVVLPSHCYCRTRFIHKDGDDDGNKHNILWNSEYLSKKHTTMLTYVIFDFAFCYVCARVWWWMVGVCVCA